ncbi:hypothetical protein EDM53_00930 [Rickettsiales endosymbiont of Peranema trichophorum]|uniref:hypothetical protein n=1 Tax=Rickettsiales endosymbiont of Peranema trichophorum TaxID=2486577 RepID=UPI001023E161|nr:hypothetical protein [Rickettsiales endosymbiont of Peranema trichophorum]RZI47630.1 hypothetical protein EDM53_00930 [Rickettsiales endosymbiont of Peranema trichophorum]
MKPKHLNIKMSYQDLVRFQESYSNGQLEMFIRDFINTNSDYISSRDDVLSLALNEAIRSNIPELVKDILSIEHTENILTIFDASRYNPAAFALTFYEKRTKILDIIEEHLRNHNEALTHLEGRSFLITRSIGYVSRFEVTLDEEVNYLRRDFIDKLYTQASVEKWRASFDMPFNGIEYLKEYETKRDDDIDDIRSVSGGDSPNDPKQVEHKVYTAIDSEEQSSDRDVDQFHGLEQSVNGVCHSTDCESHKHGGMDVVSGCTIRGNRQERGIVQEGTIKEVINEVLRWIEVFPSWLQIYIMSYHGVQRFLEFMEEQRLWIDLKIVGMLEAEELEKMFGKEHGFDNRDEVIGSSVESARQCFDLSGYQPEESVSASRDMSFGATSDGYLGDVSVEGHGVSMWTSS